MSQFSCEKRTLAIFQARVCCYRLNEGNLLQDVFGASSGVFATAFVTLAFVLTGLVVFLLSAFFFIGLNDTSIFQFVKRRFIYFFITFSKNLCIYWQVMEYNPESHNAVFARMEQKLDSIQESVKEIKTDNAKLVDRVSALEHFKFYLIGFTSIIASMGAYVISKVFGKDS